MTRVAKAVGASPTENALFDGEAVLLLGNGHAQDVFSRCPGSSTPEERKLAAARPRRR